jgi:hypothetical protein
MADRPNMPARDSSGNQVSLLHAQDHDLKRAAQIEESHEMRRSTSDQSMHSSVPTPHLTPTASLSTSPSDSASPPRLPPLQMPMLHPEDPRSHYERPENSPLTVDVYVLYILVSLAKAN